MNLSTQKCVPCEVGGKPMSREEIAMYTKDLPHWNISDDQKMISREFKFEDFQQALDFANKVGELAESEGHHPDIHINYNKVKLELWTHAVGGLSLNDFILATKIDKMDAR